MPFTTFRVIPGDKPLKLDHAVAGKVSHMVIKVENSCKSQCLAASVNHMHDLTTLTVTFTLYYGI